MISRPPLQQNTLHQVTKSGNKSASLSSSIATGYRPDIDGLRALAILPVILFHAFPELIPGGFIGVDIFFVISGFLITQHLLDDIESGRYSLTRFYGKRIRRLFPTLIIVLSVCLIAGLWILSPDAYEALSQGVAAGGAFASNFLFWSQAGYFDRDANTKILLHLWSLGVEEQFYLVCPIALFITHKLRWNLLSVLAVLLLASLITNIVGVKLWPSAAFYLLPSRLWELAIGGLIAHFCGLKQLPFRAIDWTKPTYARISNLASVVGFGLIIVGYWWIDEQTSFPGWSALLPTTGAGLLIASGGRSLVNRVVLANSPFIFVGLISYALYLWHWPLLTFLRIGCPETAVTPVARVFVLVAAVLLAWLSYRFVETPVRSLPKGRRRDRVTKALSLALVFVTIVGCLGTVTHGFAFRFPANIRSIETRFSFQQMHQFWRRNECFFDEPDDGTFAELCVDKEPKTAPMVAVWGDSYAASLIPGLLKLQKEKPFRLAQFTIGSCPPILKYKDFARSGSNKGACAAKNQQTFEALKQLKPDVLLIGGNWHRYQGWPVWPDNMDFLEETITQLKTLRLKKIALLGVMPEWSGGPPTALYKFWRVHPSRELPFYMKETDVPELSSLKELADRQAITFISPRVFLCDDNSNCLVRVGNTADELTMWADGHLSPKGAEYLTRGIAPMLLN